jgi:saccharopine dehydrogenase (NAD+, L-lysine-forming)
MKRILLYGATGYSGRLIAREARERIDKGDLPQHELILAGRDRIALEDMTRKLKLDHVMLRLDDRSRVDAVLSQFDVVLNAAGPFADTAMRLAKSAISTHCDYVDINGEVSVYTTLDDLARLAEDRNVRLVSGAGFTSTVSDVMLRWAITRLKEAVPGKLELGAVRIAVSDTTQLSRGSILTLLRSVREQVLVVREGAYVHIPVGRLERSFDFGRPADDREGERVSRTGGHRMASAANLLDTCTALETARDCDVKVARIESYIQMPLAVRLGYQWGAWSAVYASLPGIRNLTELQIAQLPQGPDDDERKESLHTVLLQIDSRYREPWIDWRMDTPNTYDVTARTALEVAVRVTDDAMKAFTGWLTPSHVLRLAPPLPLDAGRPVHLPMRPFQGCTLASRPVMALA